MPPITPQQRIESARIGANQAAVCRLASGWVFLADLQYLRAYCILMADPLVESINSLPAPARSQFLSDMALVGDALLAVTGACRINYAILGNTDPVLHAHIVPRYADEPLEILHQLPWSYPPEVMQATLFDAERDHSLILQLAAAIDARQNEPAPME